MPENHFFFDDDRRAVRLSSFMFIIILYRFVSVLRSYNGRLHACAFLCLVLLLSFSVFVCLIIGPVSVSFSISNHCTVRSCVASVFICIYLWLFLYIYKCDFAVLLSDDGSTAVRCAHNGTSTYSLNHRTSTLYFFHFVFSVAYCSSFFYINNNVLFFRALDL